MLCLLAKSICICICICISVLCIYICVYTFCDSNNFSKSHSTVQHFVFSAWAICLAATRKGFHISSTFSFYHPYQMPIPFTHPLINSTEKAPRCNIHLKLFIPNTSSWFSQNIFTIAVIIILITMIIMMIIVIIDIITTIILNMCPWSQKDGLFTSNTCMPALKGNDEKVHDNVCSQKPFPNNHHHHPNNNTMTDGIFP